MEPGFAFVDGRYRYKIGAIRARQVPPAPAHHAIPSASHSIGLPIGSSWLYAKPDSRSMASSALRMSLRSRALVDVFDGQLGDPKFDELRHEHSPAFRPSVGLPPARVEIDRADVLRRELAQDQSTVEIA